MPGPLSVTCTRSTRAATSGVASMRTSGTMPAAAHASTALRARLLNAWRSSTSSPSTTAQVPLTAQAAAVRDDVGLQFLGDALGDLAEVDGCHGQLRRAARS